jgi:ankyrin repeat protein
MGKATKKRYTKAIWLLQCLLPLTIPIGCRERDSQSHVRDIWEAVIMGDVSRVDSLLAKTPELLHITDEDGNTLLHLAALSGRNSGTIQLLLDKGANTNAKNIRGETPLEHAWPIPQLSWPEDCDPNDEYALWRAERIQPANYDDRIKNIEILLGNGVDANTWYTLPKEYVHGSGDPNDSLRAPVYPLLFLATMNHQKELVELLLGHGADVGARLSDGTTALHFAATSGNIEIAKVLIDKGADVNAANAQDSTPLFIAEHFKDRELADLLRKHGAGSVGVPLLDHTE